jgi:hypothetical protein
LKQIGKHKIEGREHICCSYTCQSFELRQIFCRIYQVVELRIQSLEKDAWLTEGQARLPTVSGYLSESIGAETITARQ